MLKSVFCLPFDLYCQLNLFVLLLLLLCCISFHYAYLGMNPGHLFHNLH